MSQADLIYLASPYSHDNPAVRQLRFRVACEATVYLMQRGMAVFSPIVHSHPLAGLGLPDGWAFWQGVDMRFLTVCDRLVVLMLPGWRESVGVQDEIRVCETAGTLLEYMIWPPEPEEQVKASEQGNVG